MNSKISSQESKYSAELSRMEIAVAKKNHEIMSYVDSVVCDFKIDNNHRSTYLFTSEEYVAKKYTVVTRTRIKNLQFTLLHGQ